MGFHVQKEVMDPGNNQKLPGFATFLSLTMPDEARPTVPMAVPSPPLSGTFMPTVSTSPRLSPSLQRPSPPVQSYQRVQNRLQMPEVPGSLQEEAR